MIHIVCRNWQDDRVLPRFARHLAEQNDWSLGKTHNAKADANYLLAYFEIQKIGTFRSTPLIAYMTHLEGNDGAKAQLYKEVASLVDLRIAMNNSQLALLNQYGRSVQIPLPLETETFTISERNNNKIIAGFSGYTYRSGRKGSDLAESLVEEFRGDVGWKASGRGWPVATKKYEWHEMPSFFQSLDIFVCTSLVEGGPMTTLEALATGCPIVIPDSVGIHPELPNIDGIFKYKKGDKQDLIAKFNQCIDYVSSGDIDRQSLRNATQPNNVMNWAQGNKDIIESMLYDARDDTKVPPLKKGENYGIYMVAFGEPARNCAIRAIQTIHENMPGVPVALCSNKSIGIEDILIKKPDFDIGGRTAKLKVYDFAPEEWDYVLYLDADIEVHDDVSFYFKLVKDGWDFVICKDAYDTMRHFEKGDNKNEFKVTINQLGTNDALQMNGGAWAFRRNNRTKAFFERWFEEWARYKGRDQGALIRALYRRPIKVFWLCNEWNTLIAASGDEYPPGKDGSAGVLHYAMRARRWEGQVPPGKGLDDNVAWDMVKKWKAKHGYK